MPNRRATHPHFRVADPDRPATGKEHCGTGHLTLLGDSTPTSRSGGSARMYRVPHDHPIGTVVQRLPRIGKATAAYGADTQFQRVLLPLLT